MTSKSEEAPKLRRTFPTWFRPIAFIVVETFFWTTLSTDIALAFDQRKNDFLRPKKSSDTIARELEKALTDRPAEVLQRAADGGDESHLPLGTEGILQDFFRKEVDRKAPQPVVNLLMEKLEAKEISLTSVSFEIHHWAAGLSKEERERLTDEMFEAFVQEAVSRGIVERILLGKVPDFHPEAKGIYDLVIGNFVTKLQAYWMDNLIEHYGFTPSDLRAMVGGKMEDFGILRNARMLAGTPAAVFGKGMKGAEAKRNAIFHNFKTALERNHVREKLADPRATLLLFGALYPAESDLHLALSYLTTHDQLLFYNNLSGDQRRLIGINEARRIVEAVSELMKERLLRQDEIEELTRSFDYQRVNLPLRTLIEAKPLVKKDVELFLEELFKEKPLTPFASDEILNELAARLYQYVGQIPVSSLTAEAVAAFIFGYLSDAAKRKSASLPNTLHQKMLSEFFKWYLNARHQALIRRLKRKVSADLLREIGKTSVYSLHADELADTILDSIHTQLAFLKIHKAEMAGLKEPLVKKIDEFLSQKSLREDQVVLLTDVLQLALKIGVEKPGSESAPDGGLMAEDGGSKREKEITKAQALAGAAKNIFRRLKGEYGAYFTAYLASLEKKQLSSEELGKAVLLENRLSELAGASADELTTRQNPNFVKRAEIVAEVNRRIVGEFWKSAPDGGVQDALKALRKAKTLAELEGVLEQGGSNADIIAQRIQEFKDTKLMNVKGRLTKDAQETLATFANWIESRSLIDLRDYSKRQGLRFGQVSDEALKTVNLSSYFPELLSLYTRGYIPSEPKVQTAKQKKIARELARAIGNPSYGAEKKRAPLRAKLFFAAYALMQISPVGRMLMAATHTPAPAAIVSQIENTPSQGTPSGMPSLPGAQSDVRRQLIAEYDFERNRSDTYPSPVAVEIKESETKLGRQPTTTWGHIYELRSRFLETSWGAVHDISNRVRLGYEWLVRGSYSEKALSGWKGNLFGNKLTQDQGIQRGVVLWNPQEMSLAQIPQYLEAERRNGTNVIWYNTAELLFEDERDVREENRYKAAYFLAVARQKEIRVNSLQGHPSWAQYSGKVIRYMRALERIRVGGEPLTFDQHAFSIEYDPPRKERYKDPQKFNEDLDTYHRDYPENLRTIRNYVGGKFVNFVDPKFADNKKAPGYRRDSTTQENIQVYEKTTGDVMQKLRQARRPGRPFTLSVAASKPKVGVGFLGEESGITSLLEEVSAEIQKDDALRPLFRGFVVEFDGIGQRLSVLQGGNSGWEYQSAFHVERGGKRANEMTWAILRYLGGYENKERYSVTDERIRDGNPLHRFGQWAKNTGRQTVQALVGGVFGAALEPPLNAEIGTSWRVFTLVRGAKYNPVAETNEIHLRFIDPKTDQVVPWGGEDDNLLNSDLSEIQAPRAGLYAQFVVKVIREPDGPVPVWEKTFSGNVIVDAIRPSEVLENEFYSGPVEIHNGDNTVTVNVPINGDEPITPRLMLVSQTRTLSEAIVDEIAPAGVHDLEARLDWVHGPRSGEREHRHADFPRYLKERMPILV